MRDRCGGANAVPTAEGEGRWRNLLNCRGDLAGESGGIYKERVSLDAPERKKITQLIPNDLISLKR